MRYLSILMIVLFAGGGYAQASLPVSGTVADDEQHFLVLDIDFGTATSAAITVSISGNSATEGLSAFLGDLDAMAGSGVATSTDQASDIGTGTINLSVTSPSYTGTHQFVLEVQSDTGLGPVAYTGTVASTTLAPGAITLASTNSHVDSAGLVAVRLRRSGARQVTAR
ncbi:MAG: hypothetical protein K8I27_03715 [Planctomycetes bacterium]|nr:hypothetical protein [Planctomycetota bacterium]